MCSARDPAPLNLLPSFFGVPIRHPCHFGYGMPPGILGKLKIDTEGLFDSGVTMPFQTLARKSAKKMNPDHRRVQTTEPVAIKIGQGRLHIPEPRPAIICECPDCETNYSLFGGFSEERVLLELKDDHEHRREHRDLIELVTGATPCPPCDCGG